MTGSPAYPTESFPLVTYASGSIRFELMPNTDSLRLSAEDANLIFEHYGAYNDEAHYPGRVITPALYSNLSEGRIRDDGVLIPTYVREPVWIVVLTGVMFAGSGGAPAREGERYTEPTPVPHNAITIISDRKGTGIALMMDIQDPNPVNRR